MCESDPKPKELQDLRKALDSPVETVNIRLREGEYQFSLAKAIASFEFNLCFPNVKNLAKKLYGEKSAEDQQFLNKIQTILKKMERSGIIRILPKEKPWELQRYALTSFKFIDSEKNSVSFATKDEIEKMKQVMNSRPKSELITVQRPKNMKLQLFLLVVVIAVSLSLTIWTLTQSSVNLTIFLVAFFLAAISSTILGVLIAKK